MRMGVRAIIYNIKLQENRIVKKRRRVSKNVRLLKHHF